MKEEERLKRDHNNLSAVYSLLTKKLKRLMESYAVENGVGVKFKLEKQIERTKKERADIEAQLRAIENKLESNGNEKVVQTSKNLRTMGKNRYYKAITKFQNSSKPIFVVYGKSDTYSKIITDFKNYFRAKR